MGLFTNKYMNLAFIGSILLDVMVTFTPVNIIFKMVDLHLVELISVIGLAIVPMIVSEIVKLVRRNKTEGK